MEMDGNVIDPDRVVKELGKVEETPFHFPIGTKVRHNVDGEGEIFKIDYTQDGVMYSVSTSRGVVTTDLFDYMVDLGEDIWIKITKHGEVLFGQFRLNQLLELHAADQALSTLEF